MLSKTLVGLVLPERVVESTLGGIGVGLSGVTVFPELQASGNLTHQQPYTDCGPALKASLGGEELHGTEPAVGVTICPPACARHKAELEAERAAMDWRRK